MGQGVFIVLAARSYSGAPNLTGLFWTSDQPDAETSTRKYTAFARDRHRCPRRDSNPQSQQASDRRPTP